MAAAQPAYKQPEHGKYQDLMQRHLETLIDPLGGLVCGQDDNQQHDQAEQQRVKVFARQQLAKHRVQTS
jgi:hypothetical protein